MRTCIHFAIVSAGIGMVLAHVPPAQHSRIGPADIYPDPVRTPGAANPQVTQRNIKDNICNPLWSTKLIRPPSEYTSRLKKKQLRGYACEKHFPKLSYSFLDLHFSSTPLINEVLPALQERLSS